MSIPHRVVPRFQERAELLDFLLEVAAATSETLDLDRLLAKVADIVNEVAPYELFAILLYSDVRKGLKIRYAIGHREEIVKGLIVPLGEGITGSAAAARETVICGDVRSDPRYLNSVDAVRSELAVPMIARGKLVGVIDVQSTVPDAYSEYEKNLLELIASRVAAAIDNARLHRRVESQNRTLRTLAQISQEFSSLLPLDELLGKIARVVKSIMDYDSFTIYLIDERGKQLQNHFSIRFDQRQKLENVPLGMGITGAAVEAREAIRVKNTLADPRYIPTHPDIRSEVAVPLVLHDRVIGVMDVESERLNFFTEDYARMLSLLAPQIATSIENARLYEELWQRERGLEQDLKAAQEVQMLMLPREAPHIEGLEIAIGLRPAQQISGDVYQFFQYDPGHAMVAFGDVSGKGIPAALYGAMVTGVLSSLAPRRRSPSSLLRGLNDLLVERKIEARYVSLLLLAWDADSRSVRIANAGALPPYVFRSGQVVSLRAEGVPLGLLDNNEYEEAVISAEPGDLIVLYSDGITDQLNAEGDEYERSGLCQLVRAHPDRNPKELVRAIFDDLDRFAGSVHRTDDQTVVVMKVA
jgi:phosphoserine phosphatase RsbU/P